MSMTYKRHPIMGLFCNALGGCMRHESNWLEYLRKLANEGLDPSAARNTQDVRSRLVPHTPRNRDEWLQAGYSAHLSPQPRPVR
jgi:hypothetical protein